GANVLAPPGEVARWPGAHSDWPGPGAGVVPVLCAIAIVGTTSSAATAKILTDFMAFSSVVGGKRTEAQKVAGTFLLRRRAALARERRHHLTGEAAQVRGRSAPA